MIAQRRNKTTIPIQAVSTRAQTKQAMEQEAQEERDTQESGATPNPVLSTEDKTSEGSQLTDHGLEALDDSLFEISIPGETEIIQESEEMPSTRQKPSHQTQWRISPHKIYRRLRKEMSPSRMPGAMLSQEMTPNTMLTREFSSTIARMHVEKQ